MTKETVGAKAVELAAKPDEKINAVDLQREMNKKYLEGINDCIANHKDWTQPFYIVVQVKKEQLLHNVLRTYYIGRRSLPTPQWDQTVWRYTPSSSNLEFIWVLPDEQLGLEMATHPNDIHPEEKQLFSFVMNMLDKKLYNHFYYKYHRNDKNQDTAQGTEYECK